LPFPREVAQVLGAAARVDESRIRIIGRTPPQPGKCIGRESDVQRLRDLMKQKAAIGITGVEGVGKSLLLSRVFHDLATRPEQDTLVWYGVPSDAPPDLLRFCRKVGHELGMDASDFDQASPSEAGDILARQLTKRNVCLFVNQFEDIPRACRDVYRSFVEAVACDEGPARLVLTFWSLDENGESYPGLWPVPLSVLNEHDSGTLAVRHGVTLDPRVLDATGGIPSIIELLCSLPPPHTVAVANTLRQRRLGPVLDALGEHEQEMLRLLAFAECPISADELDLAMPEGANTHETLTSLNSRPGIIRAEGNGFVALEPMGAFVRTQTEPSVKRAIHRSISRIHQNRLGEASLSADARIDAY
jgi:hypothetical protein